MKRLCTGPVRILWDVDGAWNDVHAVFRRIHRSKAVGALVLVALMDRNDACAQRGTSNVQQVDMFAPI